MSVIWTGMIFVSILFSVLGGCTQAVSAAALEGAKAGITLSLSLAGTLCLWSGVIKVMENAGLTKVLARLLSPLLKRIFPLTSRDDLAIGYLSANVSANFLGLGNAATPLGIAATKRMHQLSGTDAATDELCRLVVMNTASIQLIPTTVAAVRAAQGAGAPFDILPAVWVTSLCSVTVGILISCLFKRVWGRT